MSRAEEFLKNEKDHFGKVYVDITYAIDKISPFIDTKDLNQRKYVSRLPILKKYIELIEAAESEVNKGGFLHSLSNDKYIELLKSYKHDSDEQFRQLEHCAQCQFLSYMDQSKFDGCLGCRAGSSVAYSDFKAVCVSLHDDFIIDLTNDATGQAERYKVLATLQNIARDTRYIIIEGLHTGEKFVLYYYPGISDDSYGEITDPEEFDEVVSYYQQVGQ